MATENGEQPTPGPSRRMNSNVGGGGEERVLYSTAGKYGFKIFPEDIDDEDVFNPCIYGIETTEEHTFDYVDYMEYNRLRVLQYQLERMKAAKLNPARELTEKVPSDEFIKQLFDSIYGPVDFNSSDMKKILQSIRELVIEQEDVDPNDPEIIMQLYEEGLPVHDLVVAGEMLMALIMRKFEGKIELYSTFDPRESSGEWFVVPREDLGSICSQNFEKVPHYSEGYHVERTRKKGGHQKTIIEYHEPESAEDRKPPLSNLQLYDPMIDTCYKAPYHAMPTFCEDKEEEEEAIPRLVSASILNHLNTIPFGISPKMFGESFAKAKGRSLRINDYGMTPIHALRHLPNEIYFAKDVVPGLPELMFPGYLKNVVCPATILNRAWHFINCLIGMKFYCTTEELFWLMEKLYSFKFDPLLWDFENIGSFFKFCGKKFGAAHLTVHRVVTSLNNESEYLDYVVIDSKQWRYYVERRHGVVGPHNLLGLFPAAGSMAYVEHGYKINAYSNSFSCFQVLESRVEWMQDPLNMFVIHRQLRDQRQEFMDRMKTEKGWISSLSQAPAPSSGNKVQVGMYMMAIAQFHEFCGYRWYRVRILSKVDYLGTRFKVYAIDYGNTDEISILNLRYMPVGQISSHDAYSIPVRLIFPEPVMKKMKTWCKEYKGSLERISRFLLTSHCKISIILHKSKFIRSLGCNRWEVTGHPIRSGLFRDLHEIIHPSLPIWITNLFEATEAAKMEEKASSEVPALKEVGEEEKKEHVVNIVEEENLTPDP